MIDPIITRKVCRQCGELTECPLFFGDSAFCSSACVLAVGHLEGCSTQHGYDECDCPARNGEDSLECNHCGDAAITSPNGIFTDGDGTECETCGFPGHVSADSDGEDGYAYWCDSDEDGATCKRADCEECAEWRAQLAAKVDAEEARKS